MGYRQEHFHLLLYLGIVSFQLHWGIIDTQCCVSLRCTVQWLDVCMCCKIITTVSLVNITLYCYNFFVPVMRIFEIYSLSNFQIYSSVSLTIVTMLYGTCSETIRLITQSLDPLTALWLFISPFSSDSICFTYLGSSMLVASWTLFLFSGYCSLRNFSYIYTLLYIK